ncbi:metallopeptidase TldD-related protein [Corallococcus terminator]
MSEWRDRSPGEERVVEGPPEDRSPRGWSLAARALLERVSRHRGWRGSELLLVSSERLSLELDVRSGSFVSSRGQGLSASARVWTEQGVGGASAPVATVADLERLLGAAADLVSSRAPAALPAPCVGGQAPSAEWRSEVSLARAKTRAERVAREAVPPGVLVQALVVTQRSAGALLVRSDGSESFWRDDGADTFLRCETSRGALVDAVAAPLALEAGQEDLGPLRARQEAAVGALEREDLGPLRARLEDAVGALEGPLARADLSLPLVLRPSVAAPLVAGLAWLLRGDVAGATPALVRAVGRKLFPSLLTVVDDPLDVRGTRRRGVDDEGRPARVLRLVDEGRLMGFLHSEETAARLGVEPTGRGFREGVSSASPMPLNLCVLPREDALPADYTELVARVETFTTMATPGTVSLIAGGWEVRGGRRVRRVTPLELDLPVLETFRGLRGVGADLTFFPSAEGCGTPTLVLPPPRG